MSLLCLIASCLPSRFRDDHLCAEPGKALPQRILLEGDFRVVLHVVVLVLGGQGRPRQSAGRGGAQKAPRKEPGVAVHEAGRRRRCRRGARRGREQAVGQPPGKAAGREPVGGGRHRGGHHGRGVRVRRRG